MRKIQKIEILQEHHNLKRKLRIKIKLEITRACNASLGKSTSYFELDNCF